MLLSHLTKNSHPVEESEEGIAAARSQMASMKRKHSQETTAKDMAAVKVSHTETPEEPKAGPEETKNLAAVSVLPRWEHVLLIICDA